MKKINNPYTSIKNWAEDDRPREKMISNGVNTLSVAELIAILINNGTSNKSALDLSKELLGIFNNSIHQLSRASVKDLQIVKGLGPAKAVTIKAALQLAIKKEEELIETIQIKSSKDIAGFLKNKLQDEPTENFMVVYLNQNGKILYHQVHTYGGMTSTVVDVRPIMRTALEQRAVSMILCHNHPSGNLKPSQQDKNITNKIKQAAKLFDVNVLDHVIVSNEGYYSFADEGLL